MALEKTFRELAGLLNKLRDQLQLLQLNIREDAPIEGAVVLVDKLGDAVDDSMGSLEAAREAIAEARSSLIPPLRLDVAARALIKCHEHFHAVQLHFQSELISYDRLAGLTAFARSRSGEWSGWAKSVREGLDECRQPMDETNGALLACWGEIVEHSGSSWADGAANQLQRACRSSAAACGAA